MHDHQSAESLVFRAVADPTRRSIVDLLRERPLPVQVITAQFSVSRPAISRHLKILRQAGLVSESRSGRQRIYGLEVEMLRPALDWMRAGDVVPPKKAKHSSSGQNRKIVSDSEGLEDPTEHDWKAW